MTQQCILVQVLAEAILGDHPDPTRHDPKADQDPQKSLSEDPKQRVTCLNFCTHRPSNQLSRSNRDSIEVQMVFQDQAWTSDQCWISRPELSILIASPGPNLAIISQNQDIVWTYLDLDWSLAQQRLDQFWVPDMIFGPMSKPIMIAFAPSVQSSILAQSHGKVVTSVNLEKN